MKSTISDLWRGDIHPVEEKAENYEETKELRSTIERYYNILWAKLDGEGKDILGKLKDCHTELSFLDNEDSFIQGFSLAVKMMTEALAE